jgi:hypothetical protein
MIIAVWIIELRTALNLRTLQPAVEVKVQKIFGTEGPSNSLAARL